MKIGVLTSSRADFGIYLPLLERMREDAFFELEVIAFGTHLSKEHGYTLDEIMSYDFKKIHQIPTPLKSGGAIDISQTIAETIALFSKFWDKNKFELVITLGDRYEMFAAIAAASPFNIEIAHIHAGETTLGAIDNAYRHSISLFSDYLFVSTEVYYQRATQIVEEDVKVYNVGALSVDNLKKIDFFSKEEFFEKFGIDMSKPTILSTFHPETVSFPKNELFINEILRSFDELQKEFQIVLTMPNTDTMGQLIRDEINKYKINNPKIKLIESFGMKGYLSCLKHCAFLLGNTSSGFVEATYFPKYVINLGDRQKGRIETSNILTSPINKKAILKAVEKVKSAPVLENLNIYGDGDTAEKIISILKNKWGK